MNRKELNIYSISIGLILVVLMVATAYLIISDVSKLINLFGYIIDIRLLFVYIIGCLGFFLFLFYGYGCKNLEDIDWIDRFSRVAINIKKRKGLVLWRLKKK